MAAHYEHRDPDRRFLYRPQMHRRGDDRKNMVCVGYGADLICWLVQDVLHVQTTLPFRIVMLILGCLFAGLGVAFYMVAEMGIAPYDSVALILQKWAKGKIPFHFARIATDVVCVLTGVIFCLVSGDSVWMIVGIGTIINAFFNGPLIQFFRTHVTEPLLHGRPQEQITFDIMQEKKKK